MPPTPCLSARRGLPVCPLALLFTGFLGLQFAAPEPLSAWEDECVQRSAESDSALAFRYAPILHFGPGERYFPTLPFFTAFNGRDDNAPAGADFGDLEEIVPVTVVGKDSMVDWDRILASYDADALRGVPSHSAVWYRVRCLSAGEIGRLRTFLENDFQAWDRFEMAKIEDILDPSSGKGFMVVEYYFYYVDDRGLTGHTHDTEKVFVFVPSDRHDAQFLRIIVGAGHSLVTPNTILVAVGRVAMDEERPHIMVELGGHSSAPDLPPYGQFVRGWDANWYAGEDVWGTRDIQGVGGIGYMNNYEAWKTLPRGNAFSTTLVPPAVVIDTARSPCALGDLAPPCNEWRQYTLISDQVLKGFFTWVAGKKACEVSPPEPRPFSLDSLLARVEPLQAAIGPLWGFRGVRDPDLDAQIPEANLRQAVERMRFWNACFRRGNQTHKEPTITRIWRDADGKGGDLDYNARPTDVLKGFLYRPNAGVVYGFESSVQSGGVLQAGGGVVFPFISLLPGGLGRKVNIRGTLELLGGVYANTPGRTRPVVTLTYDQQFYRKVSWYLRGHWVHNRDRAEREPGLGNLGIGGGLTVLPITPDKRSGLGWAFKSMRVRLGLRANMRTTYPDLRRMQAEIALSLRTR